MELTVNQALLQATNAHKAGRLSEAEQLYRAILTAQPEHPDANHNLGILGVGVGKHAEALSFFKAAIDAAPLHEQFWRSYIKALIAANQLGDACNAVVKYKTLGLPVEAVASLEQYLNQQMALQSTTKELYSAKNSLLDKSKAGKGRKNIGTVGQSQSPSRVETDDVLAAYNVGDFAVTQKLAETLTQKYPKHPFGWKVQGVVFQILGRLEESLKCIRQSVRLAPNDAEAHNNLGITLKKLGCLEEAEASYRESIRLNPTLAEAHNNLGALFKDLGRLSEAELSYRKALQLNPQYPEALSNLGNVLKDLKRLLEAEKSFREALRIKPDNPEVYNNLGNALNDLGRLSEAEASYRKAIKFNPDFAQAYSNIGNVLKELGRAKEAEKSYRDAIRLKPNNAEAHNNLGALLKDLGRAMEAETCYREAIRLKPSFTEAHNNLGVLLVVLGRFREAEASYREAIHLDPDYAEVHSNLLFSANYVESLSTGAALMEAKSYGAIVSANAVPKFTRWSMASESSKLRIGFVSGDLKNHPVGYFVEGLLQHIDENKFELYAFTTSLKTDDLTNRLKPRFKMWHSIYGKTELEAANLIHEQGIHILIDLSGHTAHNRLPVFGYKPAPVQVSWLGYFSTTGLPEMDYLLGDPFVTPPSEEHHFTEGIWRMPETYLCFTPPSEAITVAALPALTNGYITFGCFNNLTKMGAPVVTLWSRVLHAMPDSKLFIKTKQLSEKAANNKVIEQFAAHSIAQERLILEGPSTRADLLASYNKVDIALDPFPYPGGTTSAEALWMGVPVLTLKGDRFLSHVGESIAHNVGHPDWVSDNADDYVNKAITFASDLQRLNNTRTSLRNKVLESPLFDAPRFARNFENILVDMWKSRQR